ncbi:MAG: oligosaccharide flippase family protein [Actinomycetota bacterium]
MVNLAMLPLILDSLGAELYGAWVTVASVLTIGGLSDAGVRTEIVRRVAAARGEGNLHGLVQAVQQGITLLVGIMSCVFFAGFVAAPFLREFAFPAGVPGYSDQNVELLIRCTIGLLALSVVANAYFAVLRGIQRGDVENIARAVGVPINLAVTAIGIRAGQGLWALFWGSCVSLLATLAWQWVASRRFVPALRVRLIRVSREALTSYLAFSGLALVSQVADVVDNQWDKLILSHIVGSEAVAAFQIGTSLVLQAKGLALLPLVPLLAASAELRVREPDRLKRIDHLLGKATMVIGAMVLSGVFVFGPAFARLWLDSNVQEVDSAIRLFTIAMGFALCGAPTYFKAIGYGWHKVVAVSALANLMVNSVASLGLTLVVGFEGALYGSIIGNALGTLVLLALVRRKSGSDWRRPPLAAFALGLTAAVSATALQIGTVSSWLGMGTRAIPFAAVLLLGGLAVERVKVRQFRSLRGAARSTSW